MFCRYSVAHRSLPLVTPGVSTSDPGHGMRSSRYVTELNNCISKGRGIGAWFVYHYTLFGQHQVQDQALENPSRFGKKRNGAATEDKCQCQNCLRAYTLPLKSRLKWQEWLGTDDKTRHRFSHVCERCEVPASCCERLLTRFLGICFDESRYSFSMYSGSQ